MTEQTQVVRRQIMAGETGLQLRSLDDMFRFAQYAVKSGLVPDSFKTPEQVLIAVQAGAELSLPPMKALSSICVIKGRPTLWGDTALGLVRNSDKLEYCKEFFEVNGKVLADKDIQYEKLELYPAGLTATCETKRVGETEPVFRTFSVADAKLAGLWKKSGPWTTHPKRMLMYKARAFNLRDTFPDILGGMHLTEEMIDQELLPPPVCDTPSRDDRRKPVESQTIEACKPTEGHAGENVKPVEAQGTEATAPSAGETGTMALEELSEKNRKEYEALLVQFAVKSGLTGKEALAKFTSFASFTLLLEEEEVDTWGKFSHEMMEHLKKELEKGIPANI